MGTHHSTIRRFLFLCALAIPAFLLGPEASADIIHYKDGRVVEGRILERTDSHIQVDTEFGRLKIALSKIDWIEEKITPAEELADRRSRIGDDDGAALFELAMWARDQELDKPFRALLREVIAVAPGHSLANELLGRIQIDGSWMAPEDIAAYVSANEAEKRAQGLLFHDGRWRPEAEVMEARGFVLRGEVWVPRRQAETEAAIADLKELVDLEAWAWKSKTLTLYSSLPDMDVDMLGPALEDQVQRFLATLDVDEQERKRVLRYDIPIFLLPARTTLTHFVESGFVDRFVLTDAAKRGFLQASNFSLSWPRPLIVLVQHGNHIDSAGDEDIGRLGILSHQLEQVLLQRFAGTRPTPGWAQAGLVALAEGIANETLTLNISTWDWDAPGQGGGPWVPNWQHYGHWNKNLRDETKHGQVPTLRSLMHQDVGRLDSLEIGVSWSVVRFMLERHRTEFLAYLRAYGAGSDAWRTHPSKRHEAAWEHGFGSSTDEIEREWRNWALARPALDDERRPF